MVIAENTKLIEEMLRDAEKAPESMPEKVIHKGDSEVESPMVMTQLTSAGYVYIWDTRTGERSITNRNMLPTQLKKKRPDESNVFTTQKPNIVPVRGTLKCMLHADSPNRKHYDELGLPVCRKSNLTSPYQVTRHMQKRHQMEWATLEQEKKDAQEKENRDFQRLMMSNARMPAPAVAQEIVPKIEDKPPVEASSALQVGKEPFVCDVCGADFGLKKALENHKIDKHK